MRTSDETLSLSASDKRFLGVCGGIARYLGIPSTAVRIIYCIACLTWPTLTLVYFVLYWCLKSDPQPGRIRTRLADSKTVGHFRRLDYRRPLYRNQHDRKIAGVCSGIANYLRINPFIVRLLTFVSVFFFGPFTFTAYIVGWMVMARQPEDYDLDAADQGADAMSGDSQHPGSPAPSIQDCSSLLAKTEARLREVEAFMTSRKFGLHCEINRI